MIGKKLRELRGDKTLQEVADALGITRVSLGYYEKGERKPDSDMIIKIARYYGVSSDYILGISSSYSGDINLSYLVENTRFSEDEILKLLKLKDDGKILDIIKAIINVI